MINNPKQGELRDPKDRVKELQGLIVQLMRELEQTQGELETRARELLEQKTLLHSILENLPDGVILVDRENRISYMNPAAQDILLYGVHEVVGKPLSAAIASRDHPRLACGKTLRYGKQKDARLMRKDGSEVLTKVSIWSAKHFPGKEIGKVVYLRDVSQGHELRQELIRKEKLASLGELSMGIAHEIRNPLAGIRMTAQALEEEVSASPLAREYIARIISEIDRLNTLLKSFFSFARPQRPNLSPLNLQDLVEEVLLLLNGEFKERRIRLERDYGEGVPSIPLDGDQMKQVIYNLLLNALQAVGEDGMVRVGLHLNKEPNPPEVVMSVGDTGKGILPEHQAKIFDPFFTTKAKGLGLGLSISYRIVQGHGGKLRFTSHPGRGTTFYVHLPIKG